MIDNQTEIKKLSKILELKQNNLDNLKSELDKKKEQNKSD